MATFLLNMHAASLMERILITNKINFDQNKSDVAIICSLNVILKIY